MLAFTITVSPDEQRFRVSCLLCDVGSDRFVLEARENRLRV